MSGSEPETYAVCEFASDEEVGSFQLAFLRLTSRAAPTAERAVIWQGGLANLPEAHRLYLNQHAEQIASAIVTPRKSASARVSEADLPPTRVIFFDAPA